MDFSRDWADTVRDGRESHFSKQGGASRSYLWIVSDPRRSAWLLFLFEIVVAGALLGVWRADRVGDVLVRLAGTAFGAAVFAGIFAQIWRGEKMVYDEWLQKKSRASE